MSAAAGTRTTSGHKICAEATVKGEQEPRYSMPVGADPIVEHVVEVVGRNTQGPEARHWRETPSTQTGHALDMIYKNKLAPIVDPAWLL